MGVSVDLYVGPADGRAPSQPAFDALVVDLIRERTVAPPCAIFTGALRPTEVCPLTQPVRVPLSTPRTTRS